MNLLYFDCMSGISGDMVVGALLDMGLSTNMLARELEKVSLGAVYDIETEKVEKSGVRATAFRVICGELRERYPLEQAAERIAKSGLDGIAKKMALQILQQYAQARAQVYGGRAGELCLYGSDAVETLVDIIAAAVCITSLGADIIVSSPLTEGCGYAKTENGLMRVPVPAVLELLRSAGAPLDICQERTQLVTPTGAAIVCSLAQRFDEMPSMTVSAIGFGAGAKDLDSRANVLRVVLGRNDSRFFSESICVIDSDRRSYSDGFLTSCE